MVEVVEVVRSKDVEVRAVKSVVVDKEVVGSADVVVVVSGGGGM